MKYKLKKTILGKEVLSYACVKCDSKLSSPLSDAGKVDRCPQCGSQFNVPGREIVKKRREQAAEQERQHQAAQREHEKQLEAQKLENSIREGRIKAVVLSTGDISVKYQVIDLVMTVASGVDAFESAKEELRRLAFEKKGDAVINCQFERRITVNEVLGFTSQVIELFTYGTVVKMLPLDREFMLMNDEA